MANILMQQYNGTDYTALYPKTTASNVNYTYGSGTSTTDLQTYVASMSTTVSQLNVSNSTTVTGGVLNITAYVRGTIKMIRVSGFPSSGLTGGTAYTLGTLPVMSIETNITENYRPSANIISYMVVVLNTSTTIYAKISIETTGVVTFTPMSNISTSQGVNFVLTYV